MKKSILLVLAPVIISGCTLIPKGIERPNNANTSAEVNAKCKEECLASTADNRCRFGTPTGGEFINGECKCHCYETPPPTNQPNAGTNNPASVNCLQKGGRVEIRQAKNGQYGVCLFDDNRQCEEWALLRGECPAGGLKITGYENEAEIYCAITGGEVQGVGTATPMCKRIDGTLCNAQANMDGDCPNPYDPNPSAGNIETP
ncbi:MAG: DUF333 domain-containing protein [Patescibacteria group bacterium]